MSYEWTAERVSDLKCMIADGLTYAKAASRLKCSKSAAISKARRVGVKASQTETTGRFSPEEDATLIRMAEEGRYARNIAGLLNRTVSSVWGRARVLEVEITGETTRVQRKNVTIGRAHTGRCGEVVTALEPDQCRWIEGETSAPDFHFCPSQAKPGSNYCAEHHGRVYGG